MLRVSLIRYMRYLFFFPVFLSIFPISSWAVEGITVHETRIELEGDATRFLVEMRGVPSSFRVFTLADPYRVVIDLPRMNFDLPRGTGREGQGLISAYRYGLLEVDRSRIVLDVKAPFRVENARILPFREPSAPDRVVARLVVDLREVEKTLFDSDSGRKEPKVSVRPEVPSMKPDQIVMPPTVRVDSLPAPPTIHENFLPVVVIDPGHGGVDSGALASNGVQEKDIVLAFAKHLAAYLKESGKCRVILTREEDIFLPLSKRATIAREVKADLFLSIHADKFRISQVHGVTVYTLSEEASDAESEALARNENKADLIAGLDLSEEPEEVSNILIDLLQRETGNFSVQLARTIVKSMDPVVDLNKNPHRSAGFRVLREPGIPSVLLEVGYLSNDGDRDKLSSRAWRKKAVKALGDAVIEFLFSRFSDSLDGISEESESYRK